MRGAHRDVRCPKAHPLIEAKPFAATAFAPCTEWPRTVMRGKSRKLTSGPYSVPKANRRTEPSPRNSRFAARPQGVAAQRRVWGSQEGAREPYGALAPFCPRRRAAAFPAGEHRQSPRRWAPTPPRPWDTASLASSGCAAVSAQVNPSAEGKEGNCFSRYPLI